MIGKDGCDYDSEWEALAYGTLGLCGCGMPEDAYNFLKKVLAICDRRDRSKGWIILEDKLTALIAAEPIMAAHAMLHLLTDKDVITHGGSVGGSWLTHDGERIVDGPNAPVESNA